VAASCGSSGDKSENAGPGASQTSRARTPAAGTILYHEPLASTGLEKKTVPPKTFIFTTAEEGLAEDNPVRTFSGTVPPGEDASSVARRLLGGPKANTRLLSPAKFSDLWDRLQTTGILELPRYRGKALPEREDYFLFQSAEGRVVITRPTVASPPRPEDPGIARLGVWRKAKLELFDFLNER